MRKIIALASVAALSLVLIAGCSSAPASSSASASDSSASASASASSASASASSASASASSASASASSASASAASGAIEVDTAAKTIKVKAVATGFLGESSIHFLVNEKGSNAPKAHFTTACTSRELFDALESIGAKHGDNIALTDTGGTIEGSDLKMTISFDGKEFIPSDLVAGDDGRPSQPRFGGNIDANEEKGTGCLFCLESCALGITSNASYEFTEPMEFTPTANMPAAGTAVTFTIAL